MSLRIATNFSSLLAQRNLSQVKTKQDKTLQKLASGTRITRASDDAAGLAISERMRAVIRSTSQATRNANDGIALVQTAEGALNELSNILIRLRELSIQASSDTIGDVGRSFSDKEFQQLIEEVNRIAQSTDFNGRKLLNGQGGKADFHIGIDSDIELSRLSYSATKSDVRTATLGLEGLNIKSKEDALDNLVTLDEAIDNINGNRADLGALQSRLQSTVRNLQVSQENLAEANSQIRDADLAHETTELAKNSILSNSGISVLAQANAAPNTALRLLT
ncbi:MAG: flagellin [Bacteriovoracales bacterium]|nr:flagellin [Bacteriovoracales bacterium]